MELRIVRLPWLVPILWPKKLDLLHNMHTYSSSTNVPKINLQEEKGTSKIPKSFLFMVLHFVSENILC